MVLDLLSSMEKVSSGSTNEFLVELEFNDDVLGTQPRTEKLMRQFVEAKLNREAKEAEKRGLTPPSEERREELINRHLERLFANGIEETIEAETKRMHTTFFRDARGPYIGHYQIKAMIREMLSCLGITVQKRGSKQTFQHLLSVRACRENGEVYGGGRGLKLHFFRDGGIVGDVDGYVDKCAHVMTAQGPRSVLKRHDKMEKARLRFLVSVPAGVPKNRSTALIKDEEIQKIFLHAQNDGIGCSRSQGHGSFKLTRLEKITDNPWVS